LPVKKKALLSIIFAAINFLGGLGLAFLIDERFIWVAGLVPFGVGLYLLSLRCEKCSAPIYKRKIRVWEMEFTYWGGIKIPKSCSYCGKKF